MRLLFQNIMSKKILPSITGAKIISSQKTRLGGNIFHIVLPSKKEFFVKIGTHYERDEIIREYKNISSLKNYLPLAKIYDYTYTDNYAVIVLEKIHGIPLHLSHTFLERQLFLSIINDILTTFCTTPDCIKEKLKIGVLQEFEDIKWLIDNNRINKDSFIKESQSLSPKQAFSIIKKDLKNHSIDVLSHGDLCLPNILITPEKKWFLIDLAKAGKGDICRYLSSLKGSFERNIDYTAFTKLYTLMNIKKDLNFKKKIDTYKLIDIFWHNAILDE